MVVFERSENEKGSETNCRHVYQLDASRFVRSENVVVSGRIALNFSEKMGRLEIAKWIEHMSFPAPDAKQKERYRELFGKEPRTLEPSEIPNGTRARPGGIHPDERQKVMDELNRRRQISTNGYIDVQMSKYLLPIDCCQELDWNGRLNNGPIELFNENVGLQPNRVRNEIAEWIGSVVGDGIVMPYSVGFEMDFKSWAW